MPEKVFLPADILLPAEDIDMNAWSVIACDQFTSQPEYWEKVEEIAGKRPSTLRLMLPEAFLAERDTEEEIKKVNAAMEEYLQGGVFRTAGHSYIYIERQLSGGSIRRGLMGVLDLEHYDYREDSQSLVHATEGTVEERLPPRVKLRLGAKLEMPHIVVFIDDPEHTVIDPIMYHLEEPEKLYDFELMLSGGHVTGWRVGGDKARAVENALLALEEPELLREKYDLKGGEAPVVFAVGDGNHSLATAKLCWDRIKENLTPEEREGHHARYALVELVNLHDSSIVFEPIHRVVFGVKSEEFFAAAGKFLQSMDRGEGEIHTVTLIAGEQRADVAVRGLTIGETIAAAEEFCTRFAGANGGKLDYIHGDDTAAGMAAKEDRGGMLLPPMDKKELFSSIIHSGAFPRKSFSIGHAEDKRYYLECREL